VITSDAAAAAAIQARGCSSLVDVVTLMSILPIGFVDRHTACVAEAYIDSNPKHWAWCTNSKCQRIIRRHAVRQTGKTSVDNVRSHCTGVKGWVL